MANPFNAYLNNNLDPNTSLRDYQHASRLFRDDNFRLAPKLDFLFHTVFSINSRALQDQSITQRHKNEINMLVKSVTLPNIKLTTETANQYNRKKVVQSTHKFDPVTIKFHDDNMGLISKVWQNYYKYYYADPTSAGSANSAYSRNATKRLPSNAYGLDNKSTEMFFNHITIYQLSRKEYFAYKLINPYIQSFDHQTMDYSKISSVHELSMVLNYEAVHYSSGLINNDVPEGFGTEHYDQTPSPLTLPPGVTALRTSAVTTDTPRATIETVNNRVSTDQNYTQTTQQKPISGQSGIVSTAALGATATSGVGGIEGTAFPRVATNTNVTTAKAVSITGNNTVIIQQ